MKNDLTAACTALPSLSAGNGTGTYTATSSGSVLVYTRSSTTPDSPYAANISLTVNATDSSESSGGDGNPGSSVGCSGACPALTSPSALLLNGGGGGIAFDAGNEFRYGRMRILNGAGPNTVDLPVTLRAEYYVNAAAGFAVNTADNCSSFVQGNFKLSGHQGGITTGNMPNSNVSISGAFVSGAANLKLLKSNAATPGSVRICLDLDPPPLGPDNDASCTAATQAGKTYFQGPWSGGNYDKDPAAQMTFGLFGSQPRNFIFQRENF
jgi:hypothetical protein